MKQPSTSLEAYKSVTLEMKGKHYGKILKALKELGSATYEEIANFVGLDKHAVGRRLSEMEANQLVFKSGAKRLTKSGRNAFVYHIVGSSQPKTENEVNYKKLKKTATEYANSLIKQTLIWE